MIGEDSTVKRAQRTELLALAESTGRRLRVLPDPEGWPIIPGVRGQVEQVAYPGGARALAVFTRTPGVFRELVALSGVRRLQVGDREFRVLAPWTAEALGQLAGIVRARTRRLGRAPSAAFVEARDARNAGRFQSTGTGAEIDPRNDDRPADGVPAALRPAAPQGAPSNRPAA